MFMFCKMVILYLYISGWASYVCDAELYRLLDSIAQPNADGDHISPFA